MQNYKLCKYISSSPIPGRGKIYECKLRELQIKWKDGSESSLFGYICALTNKIQMEECLSFELDFQKLVASKIKDI